MRGSRSIEQACLKKKEERKTFGLFCKFMVLVLLRCFLMPLGVLLVMKALEDERYVAIKAYKFPFFSEFFVLPYTACPHYPYIIIESTDSMKVPNSHKTNLTWTNNLCNHAQSLVKQLGYLYIPFSLRILLYRSLLLTGELDV